MSQNWLMSIQQNDVLNSFFCKMSYFIAWYCYFCILHCFLLTVSWFSFVLSFRYIFRRNNRMKLKFGQWLQFIFRKVKEFFLSKRLSFSTFFLLFSDNPPIKEVLPQKSEDFFPKTRDISVKERHFKRDHFCEVWTLFPWTRLSTHT